MQWDGYSSRKNNGDTHDAFCRSPLPSLSHSYSKKAISHLATCPRLVIYAGLGTTIDKTGVTWRNLTSQLLAKFDRIGLADWYSQRENPATVAAIAKHLFRERLAHDDFIDAISRIIYDCPDRRQGRLTKSLAALITARQKAGLATTVITSNYDCYIEDALRDQLGNLVLKPSYNAEEFKATINSSEETKNNRFKSMVDLRTDYSEFSCNKKNQHVSETSQKINELTSKSDRIHFFYLHGYLPDAGKPGSHVTPRARVEPVITESDYLKTADSSDAILQGAFRQSSVLIVGSSLDDPPLIRALNQTKPKPGSDIERIAVLPLQGDEWQIEPSPGMPYESLVPLRNALIEYSKLRLSSISVVPVFTDYFAQVSQLLVESTLSLIATRSNTDYISYGTRIQKWWQQWWHLQWQGSTTFAEVQDKYVRELKTRLSLIQNELQNSNCETFQVQIWLRWDPYCKNGRRLYHWANSEIPFASLDELDSIEIQRDNTNPVLNAFCAGKIVCQPINEDSASHWKTALAIPLYEGSPELDFPIGVALVLSNEEFQKSCIGKFMHRNWRTTSRFLATFSNQFLTIQRRRPLRETKESK